LLACAQPEVDQIGCTSDVSFLSESLMKLLGELHVLTAASYISVVITKKTIRAYGKFVSDPKITLFKHSESKGVR